MTVRNDRFNAQKTRKNKKIITAGKRKRILANSACEVIFLTPTAEGKKHDKKIADESEYSLPDGSTLLQDTGFQGFSVSIQKLGARLL